MSGSDLTASTWGMDSDATLSSGCDTTLAGASIPLFDDESIKHGSRITRGAEREGQELASGAQRPASTITVADRRLAFARTKHQQNHGLLSSLPLPRFVPSGLVIGPSSSEEHVVQNSSKPKCPFCGLVECSAGCETSRALVQAPQDKTDHFFDRMETCQRPKFYKGKKRGPLPRQPSMAPHRDARKVVQLGFPIAKDDKLRVLRIEF